MAEAKQRQKQFWNTDLFSAQVTTPRAFTKREQSLFDKEDYGSPSPSRRTSDSFRSQLVLGSEDKQSSTISARQQSSFCESGSDIFSTAPSGDSSRKLSDSFASLKYHERSKVFDGSIQQASAAIKATPDVVKRDSSNDPPCGCPSSKKPGSRAKFKRRQEPPANKVFTPCLRKSASESRLMYKPKDRDASDLFGTSDTNIRAEFFDNKTTFKPKDPPSAQELKHKLLNGSLSAANSFDSSDSRPIQEPVALSRQLTPQARKIQDASSAIFPHTEYSSRWSSLTESNRNDDSIDEGMKSPKYIKLRESVSNIFGEQAYTEPSSPTKQYPTTNSPHPTSGRRRPIDQMIASTIGVLSTRVRPSSERRYSEEPAEQREIERESSLDTEDLRKAKKMPLKRIQPQGRPFSYSSAQQRENERASALDTEDLKQTKEANYDQNRSPPVKKEKKVKTSTFLLDKIPKRLQSSDIKELCGKNHIYNVKLNPKLGNSKSETGMISVRYSSEKQRDEVLLSLVEQGITIKTAKERAAGVMNTHNEAAKTKWYDYTDTTYGQRRKPIATKGKPRRTNPEDHALIKWNTTKKLLYKPKYRPVLRES